MDAAASGQSSIRQIDLVAFKPRGAHGDRGRVLNDGRRLSERNTIAVQCVDGAAVEVNPSDATVVDRCYLFPGVVVASASDAGGGQLGVVTGVARALDLVRYDGCGGGDYALPVASGVSPGELRRVRELSLGDCVVSGAWLGRVVEVSLDVDVAFDDGAICRVTQAGSKLRIMDMDHLHRHTNTSLYPGRRVADDFSVVFKASTWIRGYWKATRVVGTVAKVEMAGVLVYWVASSSLQLGAADRNLVRASSPPAYQNPKDLTFFCSPPVCYWSVGDRCYWSSGGGDIIRGSSSDHSSSTRGEDESPCCAPHRNRRTSSRTMGIAVKRLRQVDRHRRRRWSPAEFERPLYVSYTRTTADVLWQDGTWQYGVASASLLPFVTRNAHDFFPGQHVVRRPALLAVDDDDDDADDAPGRIIGVVRSLHSDDRTVCVSWFKIKAAGGHPHPHAAAGEFTFDHDETLSAYDLGMVSSSSDHNVFYGDLVVRRLHLHGDESMDVPMKLAQNNDKQMASSAAGEMSWVGRVIDLCHDGHVQVSWGNHNKSKVLPHEIAVVKLQPVSEMLREMGDWVYDDGDDMDDDLVDDSAQAEEQLPATENNDDRSNNGNGDGDDYSGSGSDTEDDDDAGLLVAAARAPTTTTGGGIRGVIQRAASGVLAHCKKYMVTAMPAVPGGNNNGDVVQGQGGAAAAMAGGNGEGCDANDDSDDSDRQEGEDANATSGGGDDSFRRSFQQFDVVLRSPPDHHYLNNPDQQLGGQRRKWTKRVQKEWKILENNLPDGIYTRAFEDRMDLLRAVIVGASGTPYQDGLFFFDLQLPPSSYPAAPPLVNYRSFGLSGVNPNLCPSGTVCLSLLGTFGGEGPELWSPDTSTILQVLVSIQGLVLNDQPYYNEAAYAAQAGTPEGRRNELPYGENAYLLTLQTMLQLLRRPPAGYEGLVTNHFSRRGRHILLACEAYLEGRRATEGSRRPCSAGFRLALANVVPRLVEAFTAIGAKGCQQYVSSASAECGSTGTAQLH